MTLQSGSRLGPYEVIGLLGAGGMGEVYRARDARVERQVALKVLPEEFFESEERRTRFAREAKLLASLNHSNVATLFSFEEIGERHILVMELLEGEALRSRLRAGPLPVRKALDLAAQIARGLAAAHAKGIVHRDLKPENVFITSDGRAKILDFGLARRAAGEDGDFVTGAVTRSALTEQGAVLGTAPYMSPEQVRGEPVDHRSDIFSFGTIAYEMLAGKNPFRRATNPETLTAILKEEPTALSESVGGVDPALSAVIGRCLEKVPGERFQSAADLAFALSSASAVSPGAAPRRRRPLAAALALVGGIALGLAIAWAVFLRKGSPALPEFTRLTFRRGTVVNARFSADGRSVLYSAGWEGQPQRAYSTRPGDAEVSVGPIDAVLLGVSRGGQLAFSLRPKWDGAYTGTLATSSGGPEGPRELSPGVEGADWAPDAASMAIVRYDEPRLRWLLEYPSGVRLFESPGRIAQARISPDAREVAFVSYVSASGAGSILLVGRRGGGATTLASGWKNVRGLAWLPGGDEIFFTASKEGRSQSLWAVDHAGHLRAVARWGGSWILEDVAPDGALLMTEGQVRLSMMVHEGRDLTWFDWSIPAALTADGKTVLFQERGDGVGAGRVTFRRPTDGSPAVRIGQGGGVAISDDGRKVLLYRPNPSRLVLVLAGAGEERNLPAGDVREFGTDRLAYSAAFFPGGERVVFLGAAENAPMRLWAQDVNGDLPRPIGPSEVFYNPIVSGDGRSVAAFSVSRRRLVIVSASGDSVREVDLGPDDSLPIAWFSDNRSVFLRVRRGNSTRIDLLDTVSSSRRVWRELSIQDQAGILRGTFLTFISRDGKTIVTSYLRHLNDLYLVRNVR